LRIRGRRCQKRACSQCAGDQHRFEHMFHVSLHVHAVSRGNPARRKDPR
jgi:hypothetical protein